MGSFDDGSMVNICSVDLEYLSLCSSLKVPHSHCHVLSLLKGRLALRKITPPKALLVGSVS